MVPYPAAMLIIWESCACRRVHSVATSRAIGRPRTLEATDVLLCLLRVAKRDSSGKTACGPSVLQMRRTRQAMQRRTSTNSSDGLERGGTPRI